MRYMHLVLFLALLSPRGLHAQAPVCNWMESRALPAASPQTSGPGQALTASDPNGGVLVVWGASSGAQTTTQISRYAADGTLEFERAFLGNVKVSCLKRADDGSHYGLGYYYYSVQLSDELVLSTTANDAHVFLYKLDPDGQTAWALDLNGDAQWVSDPNGLALTPEGDVYVGFTRENRGRIMRFSPEGDLLSEIDQTAKFVESLDVDELGNLWVSGHCVFPPVVDLNGTEFPVPSEGNGYNRYLARYRPDGTPTFIRFGSDVSCTISRVKCVGSGGAYWAGNLISNAVFDGQTLQGPPLWGIPVAFIAMVDSSGDLQFLKTTPVTSTSGAGVGLLQFMDVDPQGNLIIFGKGRNTVLWEDGTTTLNAANSFAMMAYEPDGSLLWTKAVDEPGGNDIFFAQSTSIAPDGTIHVAGVTRPSFALDGHQAQHPSSPLEYYMFLAQLGAPLSTGVSTASTDTPVSIFPNPAQGTLHLRSAMPIMDVACFNGLGQEMKVARQGDQLDVSGLADGLHMLHVRTKEGRHAVRFIKQ